MVVVLALAAQVPSLIRALLWVRKGHLQSTVGQLKSETVKAAAPRHSPECCREPPALLAAQAKTSCTAALEGSCLGKAGCLRKHSSSPLCSPGPVGNNLAFRKQLHTGTTATFLSMISMKRNLCRGTRSRPTRLGSEPLSAELNSMASKRWSPL